MRVNLLGPFQVDGAPAGSVVGAAKERALLATLALNPGAVVPVDSLIAALWGDDPPAAARKTLQTYVWNLRQSLGGDAIVTEPPGYALRILPGDVDVGRFRSLVRGGEAALIGGDPAKASAVLGEAVALWRGEPFGGVAADTGLAGEAVRLTEEYLSALEARFAANLAAGHHSELVGELEALVSDHPYRERLWGYLMVALYRSGRQADALATYQRARDVLVEELGLEPGGELRRIEESILRHDESLAAPEPLDIPVSVGAGTPGTTRSVGWEPAESGEDIRREAPYVGRERERKVLRELIASAAEGVGGCVLVAGEPGIGKSRLVTEACRELQSDQVLWGGCHDGDVVPGAAFAEAITTWARGLDGADLVAALGPEGPVLASLAPPLRSLAPDLPEPPSLPGDAAIARLQDAVCQWAARLPADGPAVLVIDDLHWADDTTVRLLRAVARAARPQRLVVVGTYRETDLDRTHPFAEALPVLRSEADPIRLALEGLDVTEVGDLLGGMAGHPVPAAFVELLTEQCAGNPFFIRETILHLAEEGRIAQRDGEWTATTADLGIPTSVREVLGRRLARLSATANQLLSTGALFEVSFPLAVVCDVAKVEVDDALDAIDESLAAQVIRPTGEFDRYAFTHALFRHTLVGELSPSRQVRAHRAIAEAMEKHIAGVPTPADAASLARHYHRSSAMAGGERGVSPALQAAAHAEATSAFREAYELCAIARELLEDSDERRLEVQERLTNDAVLAQVDVEVQVREATLLGEMVAQQRGADAAADVLKDVAVTCWSLDDWPMTWKLASVARRWLRTDRRDETWIGLRSLELNERDAMDPEFHGLRLDTLEHRELFDATWADPTTYHWSDIGGAPSRPVVRRFLEYTDEPTGEANLLFMGALNLRRMVDCLERAAAASLEAGGVGIALAWTTRRIRGLLVIGDQDGAEAAFADGAELVPRLAPRSNPVFQYMACFSLAGGLRGTPVLPGDRGIDGQSEENPNTRWVAVAVRAASASTRAWLGHDAQSVLGTITTVLPAIEGAAGYAPNYPLILDRAVGAHWWLERCDHLEVLRRNLETKVLEPDQRFLDTDGRWIAARIASLEGRHDDARRWFDDARAELEAEGALGLLAGVEFDSALAESRAGTAGDPERFAAAALRMLELTEHPKMAAWRERLADVPAPD